MGWLANIIGGLGAVGGTVAAPGVGTMLGGGGGYAAGRGLESLFGMGGGDEYGDEYEWATPPPPEFYPAPEFPETVGARKGWWEKLQEWGGMPGYGAIAPDWEDIWGRAKKRVSQYYWGGPGGEPGVAARVKAGAARRGVAESPALETMMGRMGRAEAGELADIATEMGIKEAEFGEAGRQSWLQNIARMAGLRMPGMWQTATGYIPAAEESPWGGLAEAAGTYLGTMGQQDWYGKEAEKQRSWLEKMYGYGGMPTAMPATITGGGGGYGGTWGDLYSEWM